MHSQTTPVRCNPKTRLRTGFHTVKVTEAKLTPTRVLLRRWLQSLFLTVDLTCFWLAVEEPPKNWDKPARRGRRTRPSNPSAPLPPQLVAKQKGTKSSYRS